MLEVLEVGFWEFGGGTHRAHKCEGQITKARWFGIVFYVRENLDGGWSFFISSNERMSDKGSNRGTGRPAMHRNVLDLCTQHPTDWDAAAEVVRSLDTLKRPVLRNRRFTVRWAERALWQYRCDPLRFVSPNPRRNPMKRRFEFVGGTSARFYEIEAAGNAVHVTFGRIGTAGQTQTKQFASAAEAQRHSDKQIAQKLKKGYVELQAAA
jgi:predicted DNA-binding WGR domain protein